MFPYCDLPVLKLILFQHHVISEYKTICKRLSVSNVNSMSRRFPPNGERVFGLAINRFGIGVKYSDTFRDS